MQKKGPKKRFAKPTKKEGNRADFRLTFVGVLFIAALCFIGSLCLSVPGSDAAGRLIDALMTVFKMSCGALIALLGRRIPR